MDTESPSLADISVHYVWEWMQQFRPLRYMQDLFDPSSIPATTAVRRFRTQATLLYASTDVLGCAASGSLACQSI